MLYIKFIISSKSDGTINFFTFLFIYRQTGSVFVFSKSSRSEAVGMTTRYIDRFVNWTIIMSCLSIQNVTSTFWCQGNVRVYISPLADATGIHWDPTHNEKYFTIYIHYHSRVWDHLEMSLFLKKKHIFCPLKEHQIDQKYSVDIVNVVND
jgi:hypothetical protein